MPSAPLAVGDIVQLVIESRVNDQVCLNVLHYRARVALPAITYPEAMDLLNQAVGGPSAESITDKMAAIMAENASIVRCQAQRVYPTRDIFYRLTVDKVGRAAGDCMAQNIAGVLTKRAEVAGRGRAGSFHLAGLPQEAMSVGYIANAFKPRFDELADKLGDPLVADGGQFVYEPGMYSPGSGAGLNWNYIAAVETQTTLRVMRRRTVGLGI